MGSTGLDGFSSIDQGNPSIFGALFGIPKAFQAGEGLRNGSKTGARVLTRFYIGGSCWR